MDISKKWRKKKLFPCSYAFIEEKVVSDNSNFSYSLSYLNRREDQYRNYRWGPTRTTPVFRLDWRIGAENCSVAKQNTSNYACQNNSMCVEVDAAANIQGYHCQCLQGYQGNPYLFPAGCQDINECDVVNPPCTLTSNCINNPGNFSCECPKGYYGDGTATGFGCRRLPASRNNIALGLVGLGSGIGCLLLLAICFWLRKKYITRKERILREKFFKRNGGLLLQQKTNDGTIRKTKHFPGKELEKATDHYNESRILGQGGQGIVYKGMLSDGKLVAIKKLKQVDEDQLEQFINEVVILSQVDHRNVVKLLGCCLENEVPLLLYEFVPHGTLFNLIHDHDAQFPVSWNMRLKIAADIAGALAYLHFSASVPIYHRDIKSSNILIGEKFIVKVSDFGTSKLVEVDKTHLTTLVKGTFGYLDPEYFQSGQFTDKSDVYSFGVVLVELLSGQKPISSKQSEEEKSLATRFLASMEQNNPYNILDPLVIEQSLKEEVIEVMRIAQRCLNSKGKMRPSMKEVAIELANYSRIAQTSSTTKDEVEDARAYEAKPMMISDNEYTWTTSGESEFLSTSDTHPFMFEMV